MRELIAGTVLLSLLHSVIPSHWLPILTVGQTMRWDIRKVTRITFIAAVAHVVSTILLGFVLAKLGWDFSEAYNLFTPYIAPGILIVMGLLIVGIDFNAWPFSHWQENEIKKTKAGIVFGLVTVMFFSPCLEIEAYYLLAGSKGWWAIGMISGLYALITITGMLIWVRLMFRGLLNINWQRLEFNSSILMGMILVATGILIVLL